MARDYYEILGVARDADSSAIKRAYRKLALKYHPDQNPGDKVAEEKFKDAATAYEVLSDPQKRDRYNQFGEAGVNGMGGTSGFQDVNDIFGAFGDIFSDFFGGASAKGGKGRRRNNFGADLRYYLDVRMKDVLKNTEQQISYDYEEDCHTCGGHGSAPGSSPETCQVCGGRGQVVRQQGFFQMATPCHSCGGKGQIIIKPCKACSGKGRRVSKKKLKVQIPAGVENGTQLRLSGEGEGGYRGGPYGDLYVVIRLEEHSLYDRQNSHLIGSLKISYIQALLGGAMNVEGLEGSLEVEIPRGTATGDVIRVSGQGLPSLQYSRRGDLMLKAEIQIPKKLTTEEEKLLKRIAELRGEKVLVKRGFFGRKNS